GRGRNKMKKQGRGIATIMFGFGYGEGFPDHSIASAEIVDGGKILIRTAASLMVSFTPTL
ncbi:unnamed protein product, partial [marine sediment metagenome]